MRAGVRECCWQVWCICQSSLWQFRLGNLMQLCHEYLQCMTGALLQQMLLESADLIFPCLLTGRSASVSKLL